MTTTITAAQLVEHDLLVEAIEDVVQSERYVDPVFEAYGDYDAFGPYATYEPEPYPFRPRGGVGHPGPGCSPPAVLRRGRPHGGSKP